MSELNTGSQEQNKEVFDEWFYEIVRAQESCLLRMVLQQAKDVLWTEWMKLKPWRFE